MSFHFQVLLTKAEQDAVDTVKESYDGKDKSEDDDTLVDRVKNVEEELKKLKHSSSKLIQIVSEIEGFDRQSDNRLKRTMSQLKSKIDKEKQDRLNSDVAESEAQKELRLEEHTDIYEFKRILNSLTNRIKILEISNSQRLEMALNHSSEANNTECYETLKQQVNSNEERLEILEHAVQDSDIKHKHHRHKHKNRGH